MHTRRCFPSAIITLAMALGASPHLVFGQNNQADWRRLLKASQVEQTAWINSHLRAGMPPSEAFGDLILNKSEVTLPLIEQKIEEVLRSPSPGQSFNDKSIDPQDFVRRATSAITEAGDTQSLKEANKLIKIDAVSYTHLTLPTNREV